jgi:hypothetical protein
MATVVFVTDILLPVDPIVVGFNATILTRGRYNGLVYLKWGVGDFDWVLAGEVVPHSIAPLEQLFRLTLDAEVIATGGGGGAAGTSFVTQAAFYFDDVTERKAVISAIGKFGVGGLVTDPNARLDVWVGGTKGVADGKRIGDNPGAFVEPGTLFMPFTANGTYRTFRKNFVFTPQAMGAHYVKIFLVTGSAAAGVMTANVLGIHLGFQKDPTPADCSPWFSVP